MMMQLQTVILVGLLCLVSMSQEAPVEDSKESLMLNGKKEETIPMEGSYKVPSNEGKMKTGDSSLPKEVVISEKPSQQAVNAKESLKPKENEGKEETKIEAIQEKKEELVKKKPEEAVNANTKDSKKSEDDEKPQVKVEDKEKLPEEPLVHEETSFVRKVKPFSNIYSGDLEIPESYKTGSYFLIGISSIAIMLVVFQIYRMRLTRAERKYGVQGNRATQELRPLPGAIDLSDSDDEDHTLFDRHQVRML